MTFRPIIGITADATPEKFQLGRNYVLFVSEAGGTPVILPPCPARIDAYIAMCDGFVLSGGDDPITTEWGVALHPMARPVDPIRQQFELALLDSLAADGAAPVFGICLGMQLMGLHAGGKLNQHLADTLPTADLHWDKRSHDIEGQLGHGTVNSHHRQALSEAGSLTVIAKAPDGVIEAVRDPNRSFYLGVQWHPERTDDRSLGFGLFEQLVQAAAEHARRNVLASR